MCTEMIFVVFFPRSTIYHPLERIVYVSDEASWHQGVGNMLQPKQLTVVASTLCQQCSAKRSLASFQNFHEGINYQAKHPSGRKQLLFLTLI